MSGIEKIAMITGAGSGIGRSVALALMKEGYSVVLAGRRQEALDETALLGASYGVPTLAISTDLSNPDHVQRLLPRRRNDLVGLMSCLIMQEPMRRRSI